MVLTSIQVHTSFPRECYERSTEAVDLAYRVQISRITVAGQRLISTDFAIKPPRGGFLAPLLVSIIKLQSYCDDLNSNTICFFVNQGLQAEWMHAVNEECYT